ncbi:MAG: flavodoxin family protein, partial [Oscillospiraceae bacterium]|nr:flavodoxin family protein [Oscillospiraceae bacterium]
MKEKRTDGTHTEKRRSGHPKLDHVRRNYMKTVIINAGPRKNWNTDLMLKEAQKGAESVGAETEYIDLYSLNFTGCRSCLACKLKGAQRNKCYWNDNLSPVIEKILSADSVIIGSPIYLGEP